MCSRSGQVSQEGLLDVFKERSRQRAPPSLLLCAACSLQRAVDLFGFPL